MMITRVLTSVEQMVEKLVVDIFIEKTISLKIESDNSVTLT